MISIYSYIPNNTNDLSFINYFCSFSSDVSLTVSDRMLYSTIESYKYSNLQIQYKDYDNVSEMHNIALVSTKHPIKVCLQPDEHIKIEFKTLWYDLASILLKDKVDAYAIPLFDHNMKYITSKWFMHKDGCIRGNPVNVSEIYKTHTDGMDLISSNTKDMVLFKATPINLDHTTQNHFPFVLQN